ncbi:MAG: YbaK/EbsC family protein [Xanthomonadales bacterium]|nr:YbaK/EbsC family protein [Gammaproteobacteria bacterium]MBT8053207.1 YbaK/EbsC family protein [Gammaproteobacteria bacterium]NND57183.1 YbaK/EbsC family protein [Xanthomonadales bacterium]NNK50247.1 YbaK/EbsC family protein [Xanthomonadales bacterium]
MAIAKTLIDYLDKRGVDYKLVEHEHSATALESAHSAHIPAHQVAKAVVMRDDQGYVLGVLPANHSLELDWVNAELNRGLEMACEDEFKKLFDDCEIGAVPALGDAYGLKVIWDDDLQYTADVYIEAGDHEHLVWLERKAFKKLMKSLPHTIISSDSEVGGWKF